jgi:hypothetical protein
VGLQVFVPAAYKSASDVALLQTIFLANIPTGYVDLLRQQLKTRTSSLYTSADGVPGELAQHLDGSYSVTALATTDAGNAAASNGSPVGAASDDGKTRRDAIIGVVSALGGVTLVVLVLLIFRSLKRRQELAHRRLSEAPTNNYMGERPDGQEFDRDSVGGQRRRSFYFAADSLRGAESHAEYDEYSAHAPPAMRQRVQPGAAISGPYLRENTMNW